MKKEIYKIVPQMKDYDNIEGYWYPFIMRFHRKNVSLPSVTTDDYGFRNTILKNKSKFYLSNYLNHFEGKLGVMIGSSTCFGVGASSDKFTISSILSQNTNFSWFNLGGRAFNSTQEWILFSLYLPKKIDVIIIFSGINNLILSYLTQTSPFINSIFSNFQYDYLMNTVSKGIKNTIKYKLFCNKKINNIDKNKKYNNILHCFQRDMDMWNHFRCSFNCKLYFVFQPIATWIEKDLTSEEEKIFDILDNMQEPTWKIIYKHILEDKDKYLNDIKNICNKFNIPFLDINSKNSFCKNEWLFVDRVHLTDNGYQLVQEEIQKEFKL